MRNVPAYIGPNLLAAGSTLVRCADEGLHVRVPARAGGLALEEIGSGAVTAGQAETILVEEGYIRLNRSGIMVGPQTRKITLPRTLEEAAADSCCDLQGSRLHSFPELTIQLNRRFSPNEYAICRDCSLPAGKGRRILQVSLLKDRAFRPLANMSLNLGRAAAALRPEMGTVFQEDGKATVFQARDCYNLNGNETRKDEYGTVLEMIRDGNMGWSDPESEKQSDIRIHAGIPLTGGKEAALAEYSEPETEPLRDGFLGVQVCFRLQKLFFPGLLPIRYGGNDYYLYSRKRLTADPACPYEREDMGIFDREGLVTDRKLAEAVYGKARMLMLL